MSPQSPATGEYAPLFRDYVSIAERIGVEPLLSRQDTDLARLCGGLDERAALHRYDRGKWSVKEVIGHIADTERILTYRALHIARGDATPLPGFDENSYVAAAEFDRRATEDLIREFGAVRDATRTLFGGFGGREWRREGVVNGTPLTVRAIVFIVVGHAEHHLRILRERYGLT